MDRLTALVGELEAMLAKANEAGAALNNGPKAGEIYLGFGAAYHRAQLDLQWATRRALPTLLAALKARGYMADTLVKLRADLAEEDAEIHAQRIAVIDDTLARASIEGNPTA